MRLRGRLGGTEEGGYSLRLKVPDRKLNKLVKQIKQLKNQNQGSLEARPRENLKIVFKLPDPDLVYEIDLSYK